MERMQNPTGLLLCLSWVVVYEKEEEEEDVEVVGEGEAIVSKPKLHWGKKLQQARVVCTYYSSHLKCG